MPKIKFKCAGCGKEFEPTNNQRCLLTCGCAKNLFCCVACRTAWHNHNVDREKCAKKVDGHRRERNAARNFRHLMAMIPERCDFTTCYLKEARAILLGHKSRLNRCVHLAGDD